MVLKKHATATLLPVSRGSEVVVATTFNFHRIYRNESQSISVIVKSVNKLYKWYVTLTLVASTVSVCTLTEK